MISHGRVRATVLALIPSAAACGPSVSSVSIEPANVVFTEKGKEAVLKADPKDANGQPVIEAVLRLQWSSSNPAVATVSGNGVVKAAGPGQTKIVATVGGASGSADVTVSIPSKLEIEPASVELLGVGKQAVLVAKVADEGGKELTNQPVTWSTSDNKVVNIEEGKVTAKGSGEAEITATLGSLTATSKVKVTLPPVAKFTIEPADYTIAKAGDAGKLKLVALDAQGQEIKGLNADWVSSDPQTVEVFESGQLHSIKKGRVKIKATYLDKSAEASVTVK
jgi:uncharacterized protein YjdB